MAFFFSIHVLKAVLPSVEFRNLSFSLSPRPPLSLSPFLSTKPSKFPETNSSLSSHLSPQVLSDFGSVCETTGFSESLYFPSPLWPVAFYGVNQILLFFFTLSPFPIHSALLTLILPPSPHGAWAY